MVSELTLKQISLAELYKNVQEIECVKDPIFHFKENCDDYQHSLYSDY
ncbi:MAG: hypothetical protein ACTSWX_13365 [Promethearchaeota archaeon]